MLVPGRVFAARPFEQFDSRFEAPGESGVLRGRPICVFLRVSRVPLAGRAVTYPVIAVGLALQERRDVHVCAVGGDCDRTAPPH